MPIPYITNRWQAVWFDFGPGLNTIDAPGLPPVLTVRIVTPPMPTPTPAPSPTPTPANSAQPTPLPLRPTVEYLPAWLVSAELLASMCWRMDQANKIGPSGSLDGVRRTKRWLALLDALGGIFERLKGKCCDCYERYELSGGPPPLPTQPSLTIARRSGNVAIHSPWDGEVMGVECPGIAPVVRPVNGVVTSSLVLFDGQDAGDVGVTGVDPGDRAESSDSVPGTPSSSVQIQPEVLRSTLETGSVGLLEVGGSQHHSSGKSTGKSKVKSGRKSGRDSGAGKLLF